LASQLPPGATAAAQERGRTKKLDAVVEDVLEELERCVSGYHRSTV
jgi:hypothetical protein